MGAQRLPFLSLLLKISPQIDCGIDHEHKGDGVDVLIVTPGTSMHICFRSLAIVGRPTLYHRHLTDQTACQLSGRKKHTQPKRLYMYTWLGVQSIVGLQLPDRL